MKAARAARLCQGFRALELNSEGTLSIPNSAGLGVSINMDAAEKYTGKRIDSARRSL
jgi:hypothetical protein